MPSLQPDSWTIGTYGEKPGENPVCYLCLISENREKITKVLRASGFKVLGIHRTERKNYTNEMQIEIRTQTALSVLTLVCSR